MDENNTNDVIVEDNTYEGSDGRKNATISMITGIISVAVMCGGYSAIAGVVLGIIALANASKAKSLGCENNKRKAGFILGLIGLIGSVIVFVACVACAGVGAAAGMTGAFDDVLNSL